MFQLIFSWKKNFVIKISWKSYGSVWQWDIIGSGNGLVPVQHQTITWTNDDPFTDTYAPLTSMS